MNIFHIYRLLIIINIKNPRDGGFGVQLLILFRWFRGQLSFFLFFFVLSENIQRTLYICFNSESGNDNGDARVKEEGRKLKDGNTFNRCRIIANSGFENIKYKR